MSFAARTPLWLTGWLSPATVRWSVRFLAVVDPSAMVRCWRVQTGGLRPAVDCLPFGVPWSSFMSRGLDRPVSVSCFALSRVLHLVLGLDNLAGGLSGPVSNHLCMVHCRVCSRRSRRSRWSAGPSHVLLRLRAFVCHGAFGSASRPTISGDCITPTLSGSYTPKGPLPALPFGAELSEAGC
jgi:hypothetical protein